MFGVDSTFSAGVNGPMLGAAELLMILERRGVTRADIGRLLDLPSSRVSEMYSAITGGKSKSRRLQLDEAKKLVEFYRLENGAESPAASPLSELAAKQMAIYAAAHLDAAVDPDDPRVDELARVYRAFAQFAADPRARESEEAILAFLQGYRTAQDQAGSR